jgi:hypothetical protein
VQVVAVFSHEAQLSEQGLQVLLTESKNLFEAQLAEQVWNSGSNLSSELQVRQLLFSVPEQVAHDALQDLQVLSVVDPKNPAPHSETQIVPFKKLLLFCPEQLVH